MRQNNLGIPFLCIRAVGTALRCELSTGYVTSPHVAETGYFLNVHGDDRRTLQLAIFEHHLQLVSSLSTKDGRGARYLFWERRKAGFLVELSHPIFPGMTVIPR